MFLDFSQRCIGVLLEKFAELLQMLTVKCRFSPNILILRLDGTQPFTLSQKFLYKSKTDLKPVGNLLSGTFTGIICSQ